MAIPEIILSWMSAKGLGTLQCVAPLALKPRDNCYCARCGVKGRALGASAKPISPLDASSCALKLDLSLCLGRACGKGVPSRNSESEDHCRCDGAVLSGCTLQAGLINVRFQATASPPHMTTLCAKLSASHIVEMMPATETQASTSPSNL